MTNPAVTASAATAAVRAPSRKSSGAATSAASYPRIDHAGAGVIAIRASGNAGSVRTIPSIHASSHELRFATACASGADHVSASCAAPSAMIAATHGTTARLARAA